MFVLAHLSDIHLGPLPTIPPLELFSKRGLGFLNWLRKRHRMHRPEVLARLIADLKSQPADHVAVTGDLVNLSLSTEFAPARAWLDRLGPPQGVTFVPGNHDRYVRAAEGLAAQVWGTYMQGDAHETFPFVRRRGPVGLIGLSTSLPTWPFAATGTLGPQQIERLAELLAALADEKRFRVVLIHHPPSAGSSFFRRLTDAQDLRDVLGRHGAELVLHGHLHESSLAWLDGPRARIPCVGVPSASGAPGFHDDPAAYNLYEISGKPGGWRCTVVTRGLGRDGNSVTEIARTELAY